MNLKLWIGAVIALIASSATGIAVAGCVDDPLITGTDKIASALQLQGQGTFSCADIGMYEPAGFSYTTNTAGTAVTQWEVTGTGTDANPEQIDALWTSPSSGKRCLYSMEGGVSADGTAEEPIHLTNTDDDALASRHKAGVAACSNGQFIEPPPAPPPAPPAPEIDFTCNDQVIGIDDGETVCDPLDTECTSEYLVVTAHSLNGAAVCTGALGGGANQVECVNQCRERDITIDCSASVGVDGRIPLECSRCLTRAEVGDGDEREFCWAYVDKVCEVGDETGECGTTSVEAPSYRPTEVLRTVSNETTFFDGSTCYLQSIKLWGKVYYYTTCSP
jgi:hypothetical protein